MRARVGVLRAAGRLVAAGWLTLAVGCGDDPNDTTIIIGATPTPGVGVRTATPAIAPTPTAALATPTTTATTAALPTETAAGATATPVAVTPTSGGTPAPTATPSGAIDADVQRIADDILPFLANTQLLTGGSIEGASTALLTDPCPDGGARLDDEEAPARTLTFQDCRATDDLGSFEFDGQVVVTLNGFAGGSIAFDVTIRDLATDRSVAFAGTLPLEIESEGFVLAGSLAVSTPGGGLTLVSDDVTINANRKIIAGSGAITDDADAFGLQTVAYVVTSRGASSNLTVTFDDASVHTYTLDLATGELAQTS